MEIVSIRLLIAHWLAFINALQQFFWDHTPQLLLSTVRPRLIEGSSEFTQTFPAQNLGDPLDYGYGVDPATICFVPTIFQTLFALNVSCSVDPSSQNYVFMDILAWRPSVSRKDVPPMSASAQVEEDHIETNMTGYGARGLSFCPVLVGIMYIQSLLHLYMLLMIPCLFNHWFEDVLVYNALNPNELLECSWFLHASLWMVPWSLFRYGVLKAVSCLYWVQRVTNKPAYPELPQIVVIRADGKVVPVNFMEVSQSGANVGVCSSSEATSSEVDIREVVSSDDNPQDSMQSLVPSGESCIATNSEALPALMVSHMDEREGGVVEVQNTIEIGAPVLEFAEDFIPSVNQVSDEQLQMSPGVGELEDEPFQLDEKDILPEALVIKTHACDIDEPKAEPEGMTFPEVVHVDVCQDHTEGLSRQENSNLDGQDPIINDPGPNETRALLECIDGTSSFMESQVVDGDVARMEDCRQVSSSTSHTGEGTWAWNLESLLGDVPVEPFDPLMDRRDTLSPELAVRILTVQLSEKLVEENEVIVDSPSPSLTGKPIVNLPSLVTIREDIRFWDMDPVVSVSAATNEDIATRSPIEILAPIVPVVAINMSCITNGEEQRQIPLESKEPHRSSPRAGHPFATCETMDIVFHVEAGSCLPSVSIEDSNSVCSLTINCGPCIGDVRRSEIALSTPESVSKVGTAEATTSMVDTDISSSASESAPGTPKHEPRVEILYETPRYHADRKDIVTILQDELRRPEPSALNKTCTKKHRPDASGSPQVPKMENQVNSIATEGCNNPTVTKLGQLAGPSVTLAAKLPKPSGWTSTSVDARKKVISPSVVSAEKKICELDYDESPAVDTPWHHPSSTSKSLPERALSGSMHAPPEALLTRQIDTHIVRAPVLYETSPFKARSVSPERPEERKRGISKVTKTGAKHEQDLSASIHAPQRISGSEVQSLVSQSRDDGNCDHRRSVTSSVVSEQTSTKLAPNWAAMPDVVDAFHMFKKSSSVNTARKMSSVKESPSKGPMPGVVDRKGTATNSLNNIPATANIQNRWMHGSSLLLVRDLVSSDPVDFNLRSCMQPKISRIHGISSVPVQQIGILDIPPCALKHEKILPIGHDGDFSSTVAGSTGTRHQQRVLAQHYADTEKTFGCQRWTAYRD